MNPCYDINSSKVTHREYWWGNKSPLVLIGWIVKWLHIRLPSSSDDPNIESVQPCVVADLPLEVQARFQPLTAQLVALEFHSPVYHVIEDPGTGTKISWATFLHPLGNYFARIHNRTWSKAPKASRALSPMFFTEFADGTFLVSSAAKPDMLAPASVQMNRMHNAPVEKLWAAHQQFVYSEVSGVGTLYFDADGSGAGAAEAIMSFTAPILSGNHELQASDFLLLAR